MKKLIAACAAALALAVPVSQATATGDGLGAICNQNNYAVASSFYKQTAEFYNATAIDFIKKGDLASAQVYQQLAVYYNSYYAWLFYACANR